MKGEILRRIPPEQQEILGQVIRFGLTGGFVTVLYAAVYGLVAELPVPLPPNRHLQFGNLCGYLVAVAIGYLLHSRWSFRGHGRRDDVRRTTLRFFIVSLISLVVNAFWTWLLAAEFEWGRYAPLIPICFVTPLVTFTLNRRWVFA